MSIILEVEKPLIELSEKIEALRQVNKTGKVDLSAEIAALEVKAETLKQDIYGNLSAWDRVTLARHIKRPTTLDYIKNVFTEFMELHGDRLFSDDPALVGGFAKLEDQPCVVLGHQKGKDTKENVMRNFGMVNPEGFRKAGRLMRLAGKFGLPVVIFIDTPGAFPGLEAEERGQYEAIAHNIMEMMDLPTYIICVVIGEGGSGGAFAIGVGDRVIILENSIYSVISPEGCASILWRDSTRAPEAAAALKLTSAELFKSGMVDEVISEPMGGAHKDEDKVYPLVKDALLRHLKDLKKHKPKDMPKLRYERYRKFGKFKEE
jgi:acetyl-CoA carboxylase carboxyl transferase subunit alpha